MLGLIVEATMPNYCDRKQGHNPAPGPQWRRSYIERAGYGVTFGLPGIIPGEECGVEDRVRTGDLWNHNPAL